VCGESNRIVGGRAIAARVERFCQRTIFWTDGNTETVALIDDVVEIICGCV